MVIETKQKKQEKSSSLVKIVISVFTLINIQISIKLTIKIYFLIKMKHTLVLHFLKLLQRSNGEQSKARVSKGFILLRDRALLMLYSTLLMVLLTL